MWARKALFPLVLAAFLAFATMHGFAAPDDDDATEPAPGFHAKTLDGEFFNNASIKGKVVLIDFWTTWCKYCRME